MTSIEKELFHSDNVNNKSLDKVTPINHIDTALVAQLFDESGAMARYALSNGLDVNASTVNLLNELVGSRASTGVNSVKSLAEVHATLAKIVYPATPSAITLLDNEKRRRPFMYFLGPVPLIRRLSFVATFFLVALLSVSLDSGVNVENINKGLLHSSNHTLFMNQLFLMFCAGLGASFSALFLANQFIAKATYDPRFDSSYWSRIILGLIAGIIIVELLPSSLFDEGTMKSFGKPSLAMLGGFSAGVVYRILQRLIDSLETLVKGKKCGTEEQQRIALQSKASEQQTRLNADTAGKLVKLLQELQSNVGDDPAEKINAMIRELLPNSERST